MANASARVGKRTLRTIDEFIERSTETLSAETTFYTNAMIGVDESGYFCKADDTQSWTFAGLVRGQEGNPVLPAGTAGDGTLELDIQCPRFFELAIASIAVTDIGKKVYAVDDQTGTLDASTRTYANLVGTVAWVENLSGVAVSGIAWIKPAYGGVVDNGAHAAAKWMAATGNQTLSKMDLNKTVFLPNTAAHELALPAIADTQAGDYFRFLKTTSDAAAVTLTTPGAETIDGGNTLATIDAQYDCATLVSTGAHWIVLARDIT